MDERFHNQVSGKPLPKSFDTELEALKNEYLKTKQTLWWYTEKTYLGEEIHDV